MEDLLKLSEEELTIVDSACDAITDLAKLVDELAERSLDSYRPYTDYFDGIKHRCKKIVAGLDKLEERLDRADRDEILTLLQK